MNVSLLSIMNAENASINIEVPVDFTEIVRMGETYSITEGQSVSLTAVHVKEDDWKIILKGEVEVTIPCDRCLVPVKVRVPLDYDSDLKDEEDSKQDDEMPYMEGYDLDVDQLICSEILIGWPDKTLCREDCLGICKTCGANRNLEPCGCEDFTPDPRMAAIQDIFRKHKEV